LTDGAAIRRLLLRHGLRPTRGLGQHFLADEAILKAIARACEPDQSTMVIEIGSGIGNLTLLLALAGARVTGIEIDRKFASLHKEVFQNRSDLIPEVRFLYQDALDFDFAGAVANLRNQFSRVVIAGNIPYQITSPLVMRILESGAAFDAMVLMMQKEVAERLVAMPGSKRNGAISIKVQYFCDIETVLEVPAEAFHPVPEVDSRVLRFQRHAQPLDSGERANLFSLVDAAFSQRRKKLVNAVTAAGRITRAAAEESLAAVGISSDVRAEQLGLTQFLALYRQLT
jgi:16S rRNA (adenine1518-N6/adenine1519-N6)-dimethyltransferase